MSSIKATLCRTILSRYHTKQQVTIHLRNLHIVFTNPIFTISIFTNYVNKFLFYSNSMCGLSLAFVYLSDTTGSECLGKGRGSHFGQKHFEKAEKESPENLCYTSMP